MFEPPVRASTMPYFSAACLAIGTPYKRARKDKRMSTAAGHYCAFMTSRSALGMTHTGFVYLLMLPNDGGHLKCSEHACPAPHSHLPGSLWIAQQTQLRRQAPRRFQPPRAVRSRPARRIRDAADRRGHHRFFSGHGFENGDAEPFIQRRQDEKIQQREDPECLSSPRRIPCSRKDPTGSSTPRATRRAGPSPTMRSWQRGSLPRGFNVAIARNST